MNATTSCLLYLLSLWFTLLGLGCHSQTGTHRVRIKVEQLYQLGYGSQKEAVRDTTHTDNGFGSINAMACDVEGNLYVLDRSFFQVKRYSSTGRLSRVFPLKKGKGPGEFVDPRELVLDREGLMYLVDFASRNVVILGKEGQFVRSFRLHFMPAKIAVVDHKLFATGFWLSYDGPLVHRYSTKGERETSFVERPEKWRLIAMTGNFDRMATTHSGTLLYSYPIPYKILEFDTSGRLLRESSGHSKFELPEKPPNTRAPVIMVEGSRGLAVLPSGHVLNVVQSEGGWRLDVFAPTLELVGSIDAKEFGLSSFRKIAADNDWHLYLDVDEPLPHIRKYKLHLQ